jgi:hypothetical protein
MGGIVELANYKLCCIFCFGLDASQVSNHLVASLYDMILYLFWPACVSCDDSITAVFSLMNFLAVPCVAALLLALESLIFRCHCVCSHSHIV